MLRKAYGISSAKPQERRLSERERLRAGETGPMIDIHSHPLTGVDDGAKSFEVSVEMCKIAAADGITHIVATPHANYQYRFDPELNQNKLAELQAAVGEKPRLLLGCDFHLSFDNIQQLLDGARHFTVNRTQYVLVELDEFFVAQQFDNVFYNMMSAGYIPIVTHPERNPVLCRKPELLQQWVSRGCLVQVTAQSFTGGFGSKALQMAEKWVDQNMVHFFATDAHDDKHRPPVLSAAYKKMTELYGKDAAERLLSANPDAVINGRLLPPGPEPAEPPPPKLKRGWFSFLRS
jgi:protein-tyrosine phosphatase